MEHYGMTYIYILELARATRALVLLIHLTTYQNAVRGMHLEKWRRAYALRDTIEKVRGICLELFAPQGEGTLVRGPAKSPQATKMERNYCPKRPEGNQKGAKTSHGTSQNTVWRTGSKR